MDTGMRDLEQIQESEQGGPTRRLGTLLLAALATVGLVFAMGVLLGRGAEAEEAVRDPLAALDRTAGLMPVETPEEEAMPEVERTDLSFPSTLSDDSYDSRPEVEAALAAAAAELAYPDPVPASRGAGRIPPPFDPRPAGDLAAAPIVPVDDTLPVVLPAAVAAGASARDIARATQQDPMVAAALPPEPPRTPAPAGSAGNYTLQVISYQNPTEAEAFASSLRARGHEAFVVTADIPDRGRHWRVRIGPFETMREADSYRSSFEVQERMNTFVVRRRDEEQG